MPPTDNVEGAIEQLLEEYYEGWEDEDGHPNSHAFYDFYRIGGRWSGHKILPENISIFDKVLTDNNITVSGLQFGKQTLKPASQIPLVDELWNKTFPESPVKVCPIFDHYKGDVGDIMKLRDIPVKLTASHVIIAHPHWDDKEKLEVGYMLLDEIWNGTTHQKTTWDGTIRSALQEHSKQYSRSDKEFQDKYIPTGDWLCVTVDYHR